MSSWSCVVPTVRPDEFVDFIHAWEELFAKHDVHLIILEDAPKKSSKVARILKGLPHQHLCQKDVPDFIPTKTDMIRSWGFYKAWQTLHDYGGDSGYVLTLDDDVRPNYCDPFEEYEKEFDKGRPLSPYFSTGSLTSSGLEMRGFPYKDRKLLPVAVQYGGWSGVLDYDAATQLSTPKPRHWFNLLNVPVPRGAPTTCCIMNCAFRREHVPIMWQLPMLEGRYNRTGDIWSGLFQKKVLDHLGESMVINGNASVLHERASDPFTSIQKEAPGLKLNEDLWDNLEDGDYKTVTDSAYRYFKKSDKEYAAWFLKCRDKWLDLFR